MHPDLETVVRRHALSDWQQPIRAHSAQAFQNFLDRCDAHSTLMLDVGCGTGWSTQQLAQDHPQQCVLGVDRSAQRLARQHADTQPNAQLIRADITDIWRLLARSDVTVVAQTIWYPNPYPKAAHFKRRWHGHPVFPTMLKVCGNIRLRTNWQLYAQEFAAAASLLQPDWSVEIDDVTDSAAERVVSPFERKYRDSGHALWQVRVRAG